MAPALRTTGVPLPPKREPAWFVYRELASPVALHRRPASLDDEPRYRRMLNTPVGCYTITSEAFKEDKLEIARYLQFVKARHSVRLAVSLIESLAAYNKTNGESSSKMEYTSEKGAIEKSPPAQRS